MLNDEDMIQIPRGLLAAACSAIAQKRDAPALLVTLRNYARQEVTAMPESDYDKLKAENQVLRQHKIDYMEAAEETRRSLQLVRDDLTKRVILLEQFVDFVFGAQVGSGVCCCGDNMQGHPQQDHSPVDEWDYALRGWREILDADEEL